MDTYFDQALLSMEKTVHLFSSKVPQPVKIQRKDSFFFRHKEKMLLQALVEKSARLVSTLHAARLLSDYGFVQEQASLQRIIDEINEDIIFLCYAIINNEETQLHTRYLVEFFKEEFDTNSAITSTQKRDTIPRKKIRAYISRIEGRALDQSTGNELGRTISKAYSGYVHAASPQIMDMYFGNPPRFHIRGMAGTVRQIEHRADLWNYFYRSIISFSFIAKAFADEKLFTSIYEFTKKFEQETAKNYQSKDWDILAENEVGSES